MGDLNSVTPTTRLQDTTQDSTTYEGNRLVLDFFLARTLDRSLAETGVLDFKFKFVPVAACRTRIDSDLPSYLPTVETGG